MTSPPVAVGGSFRDPTTRVYASGARILRGVDAETLAHFSALEAAQFFRELASQGAIVNTTKISGEDHDARSILAEGWAGVLEHERVPVVSYPYEWTFSMLRDAALLTLHILERAIGAGWILKDATPFNIQFVGTQPVFIDIPSFVPRGKGEHWRAYRQFCMLFLYPLLLKAHAGIDFNGPLRADLDGLSPGQAARYFHGFNRFKRGVLSHVVFPAWVERSVEKKERDRAPAKQRKSGTQSDAMVLGLVQSLYRLIERLSHPISHTAWSQYDRTHSYEEADLVAKRDFVAQAAQRDRSEIAWDLGSNTGSFARIAAENSGHVIAVDADHDTVERLYLEERMRGGTKITPLFINIANLSPAQGWAGREREAFDARNRPQLVICLALIHHMALSSNIPIALFLEWLRSLNTRLVIEFVDRQDEMVVKLLTNKIEQYPAYNLKDFERELGRRFKPLATLELKDGRRKLYDCDPA
jgi:SAM-dependent methyltransferase